MVYITVFAMHCLAIDDLGPCLFQPLSGVCFASKADFLLPGLAEDQSHPLGMEVVDQEAIEGVGGLK